MEKNEIKKLLYKQNPIADFVMIRKGVAYYKTSVKGEENSFDVPFEIPVDDMGDADFHSKMEGKLLIRWIV
jgi:hypothetical protein